MTGRLEVTLSRIYAWIERTQVYLLEQLMPDRCRDATNFLPYNSTGAGNP
jgi:hypothetical protein